MIYMALFLTLRVMSMPSAYDVLMMLAFVFIFLVTHVAFNNIRQIFLWSCKLITATYVWSLLWIATQLQHLPEWKMALTDSVLVYCQYDETRSLIL